MIVDDEPLARAALRVLLTADADIELIGECASGVQAVHDLRAYAPDLVLLDIQMPELNGFEVLLRAGAPVPAVIFVTAFDSYAVQAFDVYAIDYLLKPLDDRRLARALGRAKERLRSRERSPACAVGADPLARAEAEATGSPAARIVVREGGRVHIVEVDDIDWIEAEDYYVELHASGRTLLLRQSMRELEEQLLGTRLVRIHRSTIVNIARIRELASVGGGDGYVVLGDGTRLRVSRSHRAALMRRLGLRARRAPE
jgi:two-component system LytT family response regulator